MDTIETFLDAMFAPYPATPRLTEARGELRAMMEDAYNDAIAQGKTHNEAVGQVITDFGNLEELAPVLGITADIRPDDAPQDAAAGSGAPAEPSRPSFPVVTLPEAQALAQAKRSTASTLARAVSTFVCAPALPASRPPGGAIRTTTPSPTSSPESTGRPRWSSTCCGASSSTPGTSPGSSGRSPPSPSPSSPPCATTGAVASESFHPGPGLPQS